MPRTVGDLKSELSRYDDSLPIVCIVEGSAIINHLRGTSQTDGKLFLIFGDGTKIAKQVKEIMKRQKSLRRPC